MTKQELYPLLFTPILKPTIWGGKKLASVLDKPATDIESCGESWEISGVPNNISVVANGPLADVGLTDLIKEYKGELLGKAVYQKYGEKFPLLIKFIDATQDLSIQVHPNDDLARRRHDSFGKTEMWYVVDAEEGATLISGFKKETSKEEYLEYFNSGRLTDLLNQELVSNDEVYFLPAGRVHTIGKGLLIAEIQQTSDITYRIYDFDRVDQDGNKRELHVEEALDAIDFKYYDNIKTTYNNLSTAEELVSCAYFVCNRINTDQAILRDYKNLDSFKILMVLEGSGSLITSAGSFSYTKGNTYLIPASINDLRLVPTNHNKILEVYIPS